MGRGGNTGGHGAVMRVVMGGDGAVYGGSNVGGNGGGNEVSLIRQILKRQKHTEKQHNTSDINDQ